MSNQTFVLELLLEEMPATIIGDVVMQLTETLKHRLEDAGISYTEILPIATSRRFGCLVKEICDRQNDNEELITGPPWSSAFNEEGEPTVAAEGFASSKGLAVSDLKKVETPKGSYAGITIRTAGKPSSTILASLLPEILGSIHFPKIMRWMDNRGPYVRPIHSILALLDDEILDFTFLKIASGRTTKGHRQNGSTLLTVNHAGAYLDILREHNVIVSPAERREMVLERSTELADKVNSSFSQTDPMVDEWIYMVEFPGIILGKIDSDVFDLPREVLVQTLRYHQKAILLSEQKGEGEGRALPFFLAVMDRKDDPEETILQGLQWVVKARLVDATFFYREDTATLMVDRVEMLQSLSFHDQIGNYLQKTGRIQELAEFIAYQVGHEAQIPLVLQAARLSKSDLTTHMVQEFPDLQGIVGGIYSRLEQVDERVWKAIYQHYMPRTPDDRLPAGPVSSIVALADRIDTIASLFAIGETPTGSRDPFGLRRIANGIISILLENEYDLDVDLVFTRALQLVGASVNVDFDVLDDIRSFIGERVSFIVGQKGIAEDEIRAVLEIRVSHPVDAYSRMKAINNYREKKEFLNFILSFKRIRNILGDTVIDEINPTLFKEPEEKTLYAEFIQAKGSYLTCINEKDYMGALGIMESISVPLNAYFDKVLVMVDDAALKTNRLALLGHLYREFLKIAQFSHLQVEKAQYRTM